MRLPKLAFRVLFAAAALSALIAVSAFGSTSRSAGSRADAHTSAAGSGLLGTALKTKVSASAVRALVSNVFGAKLKESVLPSWEINAFKVAAQPLTSKQEAFVSSCIHSTTCTTGHGSLTIGLADGFGENPWRKTVRAGFAAMLSRYPQVSKFIYADAAGNLQQMDANIQSMIAERVSGIFVEDDFGDALLPVVQQAAQAGIPVIAFTTTAPSAKYGGQDFAYSITANGCSLGKLLAKAATAVKPHATVAMYSGAPGNPNAASWQPCAEAAVKAAGGSIVVQGWTNWTPQGEAQAASALLASGLPDAIMYDYTPEAFINAFVAAGKTPPFMSMQAVDGGAVQAYDAAVNKGVKFGFQAGTNESGWTVFASYLMVAKLTKQVPAGVPNVIQPPLIPVPVSELKTEYFAKAGPGAPFGTGLPKNIQIEAQTG